MKTSGVFTLHRYTIKVPAYGVPVRLVIFGDVHRDSHLHAKDEWQRFLSYSKGLKNAYFLGMGDYVDSASTSERECLSRADLHESTKGDLSNLAKAKVGLLEKELSFMRGRVIGLVNGNHFFQFEDGTNTDNKLCERLGCKYLGVSSFIRVTFEVGGNNRIPFDIWVHHGAGGARLPGGSINRVDQMREHADADCYIMGHDHKRGVMPATPRFSLQPGAKNGLKLKAKQAWLIRSGSFLHAYEDGEASYNVDSARGPSSVGHVELEITLHRRGARDEEKNLDLEVRGIS
jgi:predicted phosphodiesterase